ncbi:MAG TPA: GNAT family N-acetyltransferase [Actinomycetota bacterium]|nr:GNAT family N-acetyltransferase [Actinomycetota bacterium]
MHVELTDDPASFRTRDWGDLVAIDPTGTFFHTPAYLKLWWEEFGTGRLLLAFVVDQGRTIAACPFEVLEGTLRFLGGFDVTDYMGPVGLPGTEDAVAKELLSALVAQARWERADLRSVPGDSPWLGALEDAAASLAVGVERTDDGAAPMIRLPSSYADYLSSLPSKPRHEIVRKERRLVQEAGAYRVTLSTPETLDRDMDRFLELHRSSPGPKGRFMQPEMERFFRRLGDTFLVPHGFHLAFLEVAGTKAAGAVGFAFKNTFSLYNSAFDRQFAQLSPGMVLVADLVRRAIESGREVFDLLKGDLEYKYRFGATPRPIRKLALTR